MRYNRYDKVANLASSIVFKKWKKDITNGRKKSTSIFHFKKYGISFDVDATLVCKKGYKGLTVDGGSDYSEEAEYGDIIMASFVIDPEWLPEYWEEISMWLKDVFRHELEHLLHSNGDNLIPERFIEDDLALRVMIKSELLPYSCYFVLPKEVDANIRGMYFRSRKEKRPFLEVVNYYLDNYNLTLDEKQNIMQVWRNRVKELLIKTEI